MILPEFDHEMANTRKTLERVSAGWVGRGFTAVADEKVSNNPQVGY
jgi:hypothetical protein